MYFVGCKGFQDGSSSWVGGKPAVLAFGFESSGCLSGGHTVVGMVVVPRARFF